MTNLELSDRLVDFAVKVGGLVEKLPRSLLGKQIAGQLVRSGTSPAPNYEEACASESRKDWIHKLSICLKELRESRSWLQMILRSRLVPDFDVDGLADECDQLCRIIGASIVTTKRKQPPVLND
jgi:four helix bundle protein